MSICYVDTSALAKLYVNEAGSEEVEAFLAEQSQRVITSLVRLEMRCLLARRRRMRELNAVLEAQVFSTFVDDIRQGYFVEHALSPAMIDGAMNLVSQLPKLGLRSLDALHLSAAQQLNVDRIVTCDAVMRACAHTLGIPVDDF